MSSSYCPFISGIPQGSVLGPILFLIYINDLVHTLNSDPCLFLYADDAKLYRYIKCDHDRLLLQKDLDYIVNSINRFLLKLNVKKCKFVSYGRHDDNRFKYYINAEELEHRDSIKDLGVTFDSKLKFDLHILDKINKANSILGIIKRNFSNF